MEFFASDFALTDESFLTQRFSDTFFGQIVIKFG